MIEFFYMHLLNNIQYLLSLLNNTFCSILDIYIYIHISGRYLYIYFRDIFLVYISGVFIYHFRLYDSVLYFGGLLYIILLYVTDRGVRGLVLHCLLTYVREYAIIKAQGWKSHCNKSNKRRALWKRHIHSRHCFDHWRRSFVHTCASTVLISKCPEPALFADGISRSRAPWTKRTT